MKEPAFFNRLTYIGKRITPGIDLIRLFLIFGGVKISLFQAVLQCSWSVFRSMPEAACTVYINTNSTPTLRYSILCAKVTNDGGM